MSSGRAHPDSLRYASDGLTRFGYFSNCLSSEKRKLLHDSLGFDQFCRRSFVTSLRVWYFTQPGQKRFGVLTRQGSSPFFLLLFGHI